MTFLHIIVFCCFSAVGLKASEVLQVSGHVGGDVSIQCSGSWTTIDSSDNNKMYFCKGVCSRENVIVQTETKSRVAPQRGRFTLDTDRGHGIFSVSIKRLKRADAGRYCCGVETSFNVLYQNVSLEILRAPPVPPGSSPSSLQTEAEALLQNNVSSSTESSPSALTIPTTEKTNQQAGTSLTDTTVVIIVSVSLALLVCAVIPLIFYGHWRSNVGQIRREENKDQTDYYEGNKDVASTQTALSLQTLDPESSAQDASQYADIYQALDPTTLD